MTAPQYERVSAPFRTEGRRKALRRLNKLSALVFYAAYPLLLADLFLAKDSRLLPALCVPAAGFLAVTVFRACYNAPRPYEVLDIDPLIHKDTKGRSFPSRHVYSAWVIAMTFLWITPPVGAVLLLLGCVVALCRVIGGVHFPRDVIFGGFLAVLTGIVGYYILF